MRTRKRYRAVLDRAHGYTVSADLLLPVRCSFGISKRTSFLARAISARYAAIERRWPVMAVIFEQAERTGAPVSHNYHITHPSIFMTPRVILRLLVKHHEDARRVASQTAPALPLGSEAASMTLVSRHEEVRRVAPETTSASPRQEQAPQENETVARIFRLAVREEHSSRRAEPPENTSSMQSPLLERIYRHNSFVNNDTSVSAVNAAHEKEKTLVKAERDTTSALQAAPVYVNYLTEQVIQAIDRRIIAQRERLGRL